MPVRVAKIDRFALLFQCDRNPKHQLAIGMAPNDSAVYVVQTELDEAAAWDAALDLAHARAKKLGWKEQASGNGEDSKWICPKCQVEV